MSHEVWQYIGETQVDIELRLMVSSWLTTWGRGAAQAVNDSEISHETNLLAVVVEA